MDIDLKNINVSDIKEKLKAIDKKIWSLDVINIRDYAKDKNRTVDDSPFGGGSGMLMRADVLAKAMDENINLNEKSIHSSLTAGSIGTYIWDFKD